jgi:hypothetical protein
VEVASIEEVLDAIDGMDLDRPWAEIAPLVFPVLPRRRPLPPATEAPIRRTFPPGIEAGFGLDIGPALLHLGQAQIAHWGVSEDDLAGLALANVRERVAARRQFGLIHELVQGVPVTAFQSREGWASGLLLAPDLLERVVGKEPGLILAPMRDLVVTVPMDTDQQFARWLLEEICRLDPNALDLPILALVDGALRFAPASAMMDSERHH